MSHVGQGDSIAPVEVAITDSPARPGAFVVGVFRDVFDAVAYKRQRYKALTGLFQTMETKDQFRAILEKLPEETRAIIETRLVANQTRLEEEVKRGKELSERCSSLDENLKVAESKAKSLELIAASDSKRLRGEIETLKAHIDKDIADNCAIGNVESLFGADPVDIRRTLDRILVAANTQMMKMKNAKTVPRPAKRKADDLDRDSVLERALRDTFEMV